MRVVVWSFVGALVGLAAGCGDDPRLLVDLRTDYRPGLELASIETRLLDGETAMAVVEAAADPGGDYLRGVRIAELSPDAGTVRLEVRLYAGNGDLLGRRRVVTEVEGTTGVTVVIGRDCAAITCDAEMPECLNGRCVSEACDPIRNPEACGMALCGSGSDCSTGGLAACATVDCVEGACLADGDDSVCDSTHYCDPEDGCAPRPGAPDGGLDGGGADAGDRDGGALDASAPDGGALDGAAADAGGSDAGSTCMAGAPCSTGRDCELGTIDCSGGVPVCVATGPASAGTTCRPQAGECDVAESCDGVGTECPMDGFAGTGTACSMGSCDGLGSCVSGCTPGAPCGTGNPCEVGEISCASGSPVCVGTGPSMGGTTCRAVSGPCDVPEVCDGVSTTCPSDAYLGGSVMCRSAAGSCDIPEACTGTSPTCPSDTRVSAGTECRAAMGACDVAESCDGSGVSCPPDGVASAGTECRATAGSCDVAETCDGTSKACPSNAYEPSSTVCRAMSGVCDVAERCTGSSATCPADGSAPNGRSCSDGTFCNGLERCMSGVCTGGSLPCIVAGDCDCSQYMCNEDMDRCDLVRAPDGQRCDDGGAVSGQCYMGSCYDCAPCILSDCMGTGGIPGCSVGAPTGCNDCAVSGLCPL